MVGDGAVFVQSSLLHGIQFLKERNIAARILEDVVGTFLELHISVIDGAYIRWERGENVRGQHSQIR